MSLTYGGTTYRSLEEQVRKNMEDISTEAASLAALTDKVDNLKTGGEKVSLTFPAGASSGTVTDEQLATLQANDENYIEMVNDKELYYLNDPGHEEGFLTYSHVGIENSKATIKTLTITVSAKSFVIVTTVVPTDAGGKLYRHNMYFFAGRTTEYRITIYTNNETPYIPETFFADTNNNGMYCCGIVGITGKSYVIYTVNISDSYKSIAYINSEGTTPTIEINVSELSGSDTVTEL